jgi:arylsulfatase A-like enzyme/Flp pilus assembly protein TadD
VCRPAAIAFLILVPILALSGGCKDSRPPAKNGPARGAAAGCNLLLITLDTTRADHLGCYGWKRAATPALDALAQRGVRFDQAFAQVPITLPSHASLLTGTYPPENGVRNNSRYALRPDLPTLAEVFRAHGYRTGAFIGSQILDVRYGLGRGFDAYKDRMPLYERPANEVADEALAWLDEGRGKPFFAWVHFYDPHTPYNPPREYLAKTGDAYDGEIAFVDANIGRLVDWLQRNNILDRTLVVAVGDHGESLGEHGFLWHSLLVYDSIMRVPLTFSLPGRLPQNTSVGGIARLVDVMPTILDLLGWDTPREVTGESLRAALGGAALPPRTSYGETDYPYEDFGWSKLRCLVERQWKYIRAPEVELYDRLADPGELHNLATEQPDVVARLEEELLACEQGMTPRDSVAVALDSASAEALRSLGYVAGPPPTAEHAENLKDPKYMVDVDHDFRQAESLLAAGRALPALELLEPAVRRSPESFVVVEALGKAYAVAEMYEFAQLTLQDALTIWPQSPGTWTFLAQVMEQRGALTPAMRACDEALKLDPNSPEAGKLRPELEHAAERQQAKIAELRAQVQAQPEAVEPILALSQQLSASGQTADAIRVLQDGLAKMSENASLANALAWILATAPDDKLRNANEALRWARMACQGESASNPGYLDTLAAALAESGAFDEAIQTAEHAIKVATDAGNKRRAALLTRRLALYQAHRPYHDPR